ncbi:MAG: YncE family protein [Phycisphaerales bacterium]
MRTATSAARRLSRLLALAITAGLASAAHAQWIDEATVHGDPRDADTIVYTYVRPADLPPLRLGAEPRLAGPTPELTPAYVPTGGDPEGDGPSDVAFTPDGSLIVISHRESRNIVVFNAATRAFVRAIDVGGAAQAVEIASDGTTAVVALVDTDEAVLVNIATGAELGRVLVGQSPGVVKINASGTRAVVGNTFDSSLSVIDIATRSELRRIPGVGFTQTISFTPESGQTGLAYSEFEFASDQIVVNADRFGDAIQFVDIETGLVNTVGVADAPAGLAITPSGTVGVVAHAGTVSQITLINPLASSVTGTIGTGVQPQGPVAIDPAGTKAVVAILNAAVLVDLVTQSVSPSISTASNSAWLTTADGLYALGVGFRGSLIRFSDGALVKDLNNFVSTSIGAVSPVGARAALVAPNFGEDLVTVSTSGAAGVLEGAVLTGPDPEFDRTRTAGITPDGSRAGVAGIVSDSLAILDDEGTIIDRAATGMRPGGVGITPDGSKAIVANLDSFFATIHTVGGATVQVPMGRRAGLALVSPDGQYAYLPVVADGDGVYRINLVTNAVEGAKLPVGNMGSVSYPYFPVSGAALSPDGATLVTCGSFDDTISIIDTASWSVVATVFVGEFPTFAAFSPDGSRIYVSCSDAASTVDTVSVVENAGAASAQIASIPVGNAPYAIDVGATRAYVLNTQTADTISVIDRASNTVVNTFSLPEQGSDLALDDAAGLLYVPSGEALTTLGGNVGFSTSSAGRMRVFDAGTGLLLDTIDTGRAPTFMAATPARSHFVLPHPAGDGATLLVPESTGCQPDLTTTAIAGTPGYGVPNGVLNNDDFFYYLAQFAAGNLGVADLTTTAIAGQPGYGVPNGILNNDDFFYFLTIFAAGC